MYFLGISAFYHNSSAALFKDGQLLYASEEERFTRVKFDSNFPVQSIRFCLNKAGITKDEITKVFYYEDPNLKLERQIEMYEDITKVPFLSLKLKKECIRLRITEYFGNNIEIIYSQHHISHAANAQYYLGLKDSAHLVADAVGELSTIWAGEFKNNQFKEIKQINFPHSIGMFYSTFTDFLGFRVNADEYKLMGLAAYGVPQYTKEVSQLIKNYKDESFELNLEYFTFYRLPGSDNYNEKFAELFKFCKKVKDKNYQQVHMDIAASVQSVTEDILIEKVKYLARKTKSKNLCLSGGVALNCLANMKIHQLKLFEKVFIPPSPGDAGSSIGAVAKYILEKKMDFKNNKHSYTGFFEKKDRLEIFRDKSLQIKDIDQYIIDQLQRGKVIAIFQNKSEFGPRALGNRSIIANPNFKNMKNILNSKVKKRESYRPFAPIVLEEDVMNFFETSEEVPFMTKTFNVLKEKQNLIPSIVHADGTARVQTIGNENKFLQKILRGCKKAYGIPVLINTSFNLSDEPIVNTYIDAYICFLRSEIDILYLDGIVIDKQSINKHEINTAIKIFKNRTTELDRNSYTF